jgi:hypothetical protein
MANLEPNIQHTERCENLRWKELFIDPSSDPNPPNGEERLFWCLKTQINLGPDGKFVDCYECSPGRSCYQPL